MPQHGYYITETARRQLKKILRDTAHKWGITQARKYNADMLAGLQDIANNHQKFNSPHRNNLAGSTSFALHLVEHHYVAFQAHGKNKVIIAGLFHKSMDIPSRLKELQALTPHEINILKHRISDT